MATHETTSKPSSPSRSAAEFGPGLRKLFLLEEGSVYLNHGSYGATPKSVIKAQREWQDALEREPSRFMEREFRPALRVAVENATMAVNAVLNSIAFAPGDEILINSQTYNAVKNAVVHICKRTGAIPKWVDLPFPIQSGAQILANFTAGLSKRTKLVLIDHVTSQTATIMPVAEMAAAARAEGAFVLIDGAHAPGMIPLDLPATGAHWYTGNCHKWMFTAKGCAMLWAEESVRSDLHPSVISHGYGEGFVAEFDWVGTRDASAQQSLPTALNFREAFGDEAVRQHNHDLIVRAAHMLSDAWKTAVGAPDDLLGSIAAIRLPSGLGTSQADAFEVRRRLLDEYRIQTPVWALGGELWLRISAQIYNGFSEYEALADAILTERRNAP
jgi:isopenicillin-N epimerase